MTRIYEALERLEQRNAPRPKKVPTTAPQKYEVLHPVPVGEGTGKQNSKIRGIYSGMLFRIETILKQEDRGNVVQIVGSRPGEGTSTVARELAGAAVRDFNRSVLLVDMDGVGDSQFTHFANQTGNDQDMEETNLPMTRESFTSAEDDPDHLHMTRLTSTDVIRISSSGNGNGSPLDRLRQNYDLVIIDSPPMEHNRANPFFPLAGAVILVVEAEKTKHQIVRRSKEQIERQGGNLIGIVLNKKRFHVPDWLYNRL